MLSLDRSFSSLTVDVVCMRERGEKLAASRIVVADPMRGVLTIETRACRPLWQPGADPVPTVVASVVGGRPIALYKAVVKTLRDGQLVIVGEERIYERTAEWPFPQAWWCRIVPSG